MSNNLVSQQLSILNGDMGQLEPTYVNVDSSVLNMRMGMMGSMSTDSATHQFPISNQQMQLVDQMSYIPGSQNLTVSNKHLGNMEPTLDNMGSQKLLPIQKDRETEASLNNLGSQKLYPNKRKAVVEPMFNNSVQQQISMPNKRAAHMEPHLSSPGSLHHSATNKKAMHLQSMSSASGSQNSPAPNKKMVRNESISNKSGTQRVQTPKGRTIQMEAQRKIRSESFESVRSKMRESLAAALALVHQNENKTPTQEKSSPNKVDITPSQPSEDSKLAESTSTPVDAAGVPENMHSKGTCSADKPKDGQNSFAEASTHEGVVNSPHTWKSSGQDSLYNTVLPDGDVSFTDNFFVKDELLQGNGLSWAWDMVIEVVEPKEVQAAKHVDVGEDGDEQMVRSPECLTFKNEAKEVQGVKHVDAGGDGGEKNLQSPENLAFKIEVELFKLFGGVNKKYKEKGRSLMFNLKDRNNPDLRERVMSGEISPEKLCSMTAEELASKELSEWRMAKAEELAQMIVLPDSDGDRRRLVKKTHKGEYQVEVEQDDSVSVEVSVGTTTFTQILPKDKETVAPSSSENKEVKDAKNVESEKGSLDNQDSSCSLTIPADGTDLMQGLIEDEFKDAEFLPPIVSLDEFMESLNSEPPFDNLAVDAGQTKPSSEKVKSETGDKVVVSNPASKDPGDTKLGKATKIDMKITELELDVKSSDHLVEQKHSTPDKISMAEHVWEGALQLQVSASVTVIGLFRSGEKTSTKEWASSLEIKGRVRLDAFEKFLQELPMSRSRAVMVVHFVLKPGSSEDDQASLREVVDSYVLDERLGFAEPTAGMELYLTPPHPKILEMLGKQLAKDQTEIIKSTDNGLIGVVVWRRAHISSTISPNSTSHHKHSSKKQQHLISRRQEKDTNVNVNMASRTPITFGQPPVRSGPTPINDADDDDIPPGFGPGAARDDDDLPEFNFSGNSTSSVPGRVSSQPSRLTSFNPHQMRELIQKYGQTGHSDNNPGTWQDKRGVGHGNQAWNNDNDDDDIPEWRPDVPQHQIPAPSLTVHSFHQPMHPHMVNQPLGSLAPHHLMSQQVGAQQPVAMPPTNMNINPSWQQGGRWARPQGFQPGSLGNVGQLYGTSVPGAGQPPGNWRQDAPRSRGF